ncbi:unnamed protein product [Paramecium sonneborni]|uniref:Uncharacterized protein n=1 Tax=Paramecium sonneborni TaxID=65129 RepID=A0A8S1LR57_9CILI|nr:unnamed protein product [Paramecium sonneborni]
MQQISQVGQNEFYQFYLLYKKVNPNLMLKSLMKVKTKNLLKNRAFIQIQQIQKNEKINLLIKQKINDLLIEFNQMKLNVKLIKNKNYIIASIQLDFFQIVQKVEIQQRNKISLQLCFNKDKIIFLQDLSYQKQEDTLEPVQNQKQKQNYNILYTDGVKHIILEEIPFNVVSQTYGFDLIKNVLKESIIIPQQFPSIFCGNLTLLGSIVIWTSRSGKLSIIQLGCNKIQGTLQRINFKDLFSIFLKNQIVIQQLFTKLDRINLQQFIQKMLILQEVIQKRIKVGIYKKENLSFLLRF